MDCSSPFVAIQPGGWDDFSPTPHEAKRIRAFQRRFRLCGLILSAGKNGFRLTFSEDHQEDDQTGPLDGA
jgi:hypothetical protein